MHLAGGWSLGYPESPCKEGAKELPEVLEHGGHGLCCEASQVRCLKGSSDYLHISQTCSVMLCHNKEHTHGRCDV